MLDVFDRDPRAESLFSSLFSTTFAESRFDPVRIAAASHLNLPAFFDPLEPPSFRTDQSSFRETCALGALAKSPINRLRSRSQIKPKECGSRLSLGVYDKRPIVLSGQSAVWETNRFAKQTLAAG
uniref:Alpha/beta hydrolase n=1 Tax=Steinernema glaseri TaxID=37863 RepID=A0A1I7ZSC2_9BILA